MSTEREVLKTVLVRQTEHYRELFNDSGKWGRFDEPIKYKFDLRGATAGQALYRDGQYIIRFNLDIAKDNLDKYLKTTVPHELAHLILNSKYPWAQPHGNHWKMCMQVLGAPANRCHTYEYTPARVVKKYPYMCRCMIHEVASTTHNRIQAGERVLRCKHCDERVVYAPEIDY